MHRLSGAPAGHLEGDWLRLAGVGEPQLRRFAGYAEAGIHGFVAVLAIVHKIEVAVGHLAMNKEQPVVGLRLCIVEVGFQIERGKDVLEILSCIHRALADLMYPCPITEQLIVQLVELRLVIGQARIVEGFGTGKRRALGYQLVNCAQHRQ